ncbi:MAG TPA: enoyl-CoA hydratase [Burkholderiaceae bacterium]|nr:enoyl-CoA hydratase [Burkholderiaceae bacterium]
MSILTGNHNGVLRIVFNRADKKNALTAAMYEALNEAFDRAAGDPAIKALLFAGEGGVFTSGNDLQDFLASPPRGIEAPVFQFLRNLAHCPKPMVAAVQGFAVGVGTTMLLHCDLVYAADDAKFALPFTSLGLCPEAASSFLLPQIAGYQRAAEKLLLGEPFGAEEAYEMGFVNKIIPPSEVLAHAMRQAEKLAALPASSVRVTKRLLRDTHRKAIAERMDEESTLFADMLGGPAAREALNAFMEKRRPNFSSID